MASLKRHERGLEQAMQRAKRSLENAKRLLKTTEENLTKSRAILSSKRRSPWEPTKYVGDYSEPQKASK